MVFHSRTHSGAAMAHDKKLKALACWMPLVAAVVLLVTAVQGQGETPSSSDCTEAGVEATDAGNDAEEPCGAHPCGQAGQPEPTAADHVAIVILGAQEPPREGRAPTLPLRREGFTVHGTAAEAEDATAVEAVLRAELALLPAALPEAMALRAIILCTQLGVQPRGASEPSPRAAVCDFQGAALYLDAALLASRPQHLRHLLHHELFHFMDLAIDGRLYLDPQWERLNRRGFRYGAGGAASQRSRRVRSPDPPPPGFATHYATTAVEEDKAETFAVMVTDPGGLTARREGDAVLAAKVAMIEHRLAGWHESLDESFWQRIAAHRARQEQRRPDPEEDGAAVANAEEGTPDE